MAGELFASLDDVNTHLARVNAVTDALDDRIQVDAKRLIVASLAGVFQPTTLVTWVDPSTTPELIRAIAGRLVAAKWYASVYSEDSTGVPEFAQQLYNEALALIAQIINGTLTVVDGSGDPIEDTDPELDTSDFWPNDTTDGPYFTMSQVFS